jgi:outer membrane protein TolC
MSGKALNADQIQSLAGRATRDWPGSFDGTRLYAAPGRMRRALIVLASAVLAAVPASAQESAAPDSLLGRGTLEQCVRYALAHQPAVQQSLLDEEIAERSIRVRLADWFPQVSFTGTLQHFVQLPTSFFQGNPIQTGVANTSTGLFGVTQTLFNRDVLLAASTAHDVREQSRQRTTGTRIDVVVNVSKAFYAALLTEDQLAVLGEDLTRLEQGLKDARHQYEAGIVDKTDFERATVALNNARSEMRQNQELLKARYALLKDQMGFPAGAPLELVHDSTQLVREAILDTTQAMRYENRIEYQLLETQQRLQEVGLRYAGWSFLPSLSAFGSYSLNYLSSSFPPLYRHNYPSSLVGVELSVPIFEGGKRLQEISQAELGVRRAGLDLAAFGSAATAEYAQAIAVYKSNLNEYRVQTANIELARDVYRIIQLQYKAGTKTYLELITAETDLRTAEANHTSALYQVLSSKLDLQKALGTIQED